MLDNASDLQLVLLTLALMAIFSYGGVRGYRAGRRAIRRQRVSRFLRSYQMAAPVSRLGPSVARTASARPRSLRAVTGLSGDQSESYSESCYETTALSGPKDAA